MGTLYVIRGADEGKRFDLNGPIVAIGRDAANGIRLHDTEVSRRHAEFRNSKDGYTIKDLGSSNGTYLNNTAILAETILQPGDHLQIGQSILVYSPAPAAKDDSETLAAKISMISKGDITTPSSIVKSIREDEGSRLLARPEEAGGPWLKTALANLSVMYQTTQAISHIQDTDQLLERIMELLFQSIPADRGVAMLRNDAADQLEPKAARWRPGVDRAERIAISRSITDYVLAEKQGVLVTDASQDERFGPAQSIVRYGIREAICVPMKGRHETPGVIYLDTCISPQDLIAKPTSAGRLNEDHLALAAAIGHQAALAIEESRYHQAMVQAERLAAVGQTIAAISHHIKNILQGLKSGSEVLGMGIKDKNDELVTQGWRIVEKNQSRIYDLVMDMLSYSKERTPLMEPVKINETVSDVLELVQGRLADKGINVHTRLAERPPVVHADPEGIHRALLNIVGNAIDALDGRENPTIGIQTLLEADGQWMRMVVIDNGPGIPPEKMTDIFKPFISTKGARGTGLGLAVSRKVLREHGGDILVQSKLGEGSRFILRLPVQSLINLPSAASLDQTLVPEDMPARRP